jgi:MFS family permease
VVYSLVGEFSHPPDRASCLQTIHIVDYVVSGALATVSSVLGLPHLSSAQKVFPPWYNGSVLFSVSRFIISATTLGALIDGLSAGTISDFLGRRPMLGIADIIFSAAAIGQSVCHCLWPMVSFY